jgi:hypothetical protein
MRREYAMSVVKHLAAGQEVIYFDEASCHRWDMPTKVWQPLKKFALPVAAHRGSSMTILGAISNKAPRVRWLLAATTNTETVTTFFRLLAAKRIADGETDPAVVVLDNH